MPRELQKLMQQAGVWGRSGDAPETSFPTVMEAITRLMASFRWSRYWLFRSARSSLHDHEPWVSADQHNRRVSPGGPAGTHAFSPRMRAPPARLDAIGQLTASQG